MTNKNNIRANADMVKIIMACAITMLAVSMVFMTQSIFPEISNSFGITLPRARFAFSVASLSYALSFFFIGPVMDRYSLPKVAALGLCLLGSALLFASWTSCFNAFLLSMALSGFSAALIPASMFPYVTATAPQHQRGLYVGLIVLSATLGVITGRVSMGVLTSLAGWRTALRVYTGLIACFLFVLFFYFLRDQTKTVKKKGPVFAMYKDAIKQLLDIEVATLLLAGFNLFFGFLGMITFLTYHLAQPPFSLSAGEIGWISLAGLTAVIAPFSGNLSQKTGLHALLVPGLVICLLSLQIMGWSDSLVLTVLGMLLLFFGVYACQPLIFLLIGQKVPEESLGSASSLYILCCIGGGSLSSIILGPVWNRFGWEGITLACSVSMAISLVSIRVSHRLFDRGGLSQKKTRGSNWR